MICQIQPGMELVELWLKIPACFLVTVALGGNSIGKRFLCELSRSVMAAPLPGAAAAPVQPATKFWNSPQCASVLLAGTRPPLRFYFRAGVNRRKRLVGVLRDDLPQGLTRGKLLSAVENQLR